MEDKQKLSRISRALADVDFAKETEVIAEIKYRLSFNTFSKKS